MNNNLMTINIENRAGQLVVTSRQVAEHFGKEHYNVLRDLEKITSDLRATQKQEYFIEDTYKDSLNRTKPQYLLTKKGFNLYMFNIQGYIEYKTAYIERFEEMEQQIKSMALKPDSYMIEDPIARAKRWIEEQEEKQLLEEKVQVLEPKADRYDKYMNSNGTIDMAEFAKVLNIRLNKKKSIGRNKMFELLSK